MKKATVKELIKNEKLLHKMYELILNDYYEVSASNFPLENYIFTLRANNDQKKVFYLEEEGKIVSYLESELVTNGKYYISMLTTDKNYRNKGYGKDLLRDTINDLQKLGAQKIIVHINEQKPWVIAFCQNMGFKKEEKPGSDEVVLTLTLS